MLMQRLLKIALTTAAFGIAAVASPVNAQATLCSNGSGCLTGNQLVNLSSGTGLDDTLTPDPVNGLINGTSLPVTFTGIMGTLGDHLVDAANGQATISMTNSSSLINALTFNVASGFTSAEFDLQQGVPKSGFDVTVCEANGGGCQVVNVAPATGSNWFDIVAPMGQSYISATITAASGDGFNTFKQLRLSGSGITPAVPEPSSWALMLLGFGGIGMAMRRRYRPSLRQLA